MYEALKGQARGLLDALGDVYDPGLLALQRSFGLAQAAELEKAIESLANTVVRIRTAERAEFDLTRAVASVPLLSRVQLRLLGLLHADSLVPDTAASGLDEPPPPSAELHALLCGIRVEAALVLATMNSRHIVRALREQLRREGGSSAATESWLEETLLLRFVGVEGWPWPLDPKKAATVTRWLPCACSRQRGGATHVEVRTSREQHCTLCGSGSPSANTMNVRLHRMRRTLRDLISGGLDRASLGLASAVGFGR